MAIQQATRISIWKLNGVSMTTTTEPMPIDRLKRLSISEVCRRTGLSARTIFRRLAEDKVNHLPGNTFPAPVDNPLRKGRLEWSELEFVRWLERGKTPPSFKPQRVA